MLPRVKATENNVTVRVKESIPGTARNPTDALRKNLGCERVKKKDTNDKSTVAWVDSQHSVFAS